jgi:hypothetical protein
MDSHGLPMQARRSPIIFEANIGGSKHFAA